MKSSRDTIFFRSPSAQPETAVNEGVAAAEYIKEGCKSHLLEKELGSYCTVYEYHSYLRKKVLILNMVAAWHYKHDFLVFIPTIILLRDR